MCPRGAMLHEISMHRLSLCLFRSTKGCKKSNLSSSTVEFLAFIGAGHISEFLPSTPSGTDESEEQVLYFLGVFYVHMPNLLCP